MVDTLVLGRDSQGGEAVVARGGSKEVNVNTASLNDLIKCSNT